MLVDRTLLLWFHNMTFDDAEEQALWALTGTTAAVYFICFLVDAVLELWTFVAYRRMDFVGKKNHHENYRLLVSTLLGMSLVSYYGMLGLHIRSNELIDFVFTIVIYLQALLGPVFLMLTRLLMYLVSLFWPPGLACREILLASYYFEQFLQCFAYTTIACNRFTAFVLPLRHASVWQSKLFWRIVVASIVVALICASVRVVHRTLLMWFYAVTYVNAEEQATRTLIGVTATVYSLCFLVDAVLELWTFVAYQRMDFVGTKKHNENYRLLVSTLLGMILNTCLVSYYGMLGLHITIN